MPLPAFGHLDIGRDREGLVEDARRGCLRDADDRLGVGERGAACHDAGARKDEAGERRGIERQDLISGRLDPEQILQLLELLGVARRQVVVLRPVLGEIEQLPLDAVHDILWRWRSPFHGSR